MTEMFHGFSQSLEANDHDR